MCVRCQGQNNVSPVMVLIPRTYDWVMLYDKEELGSRGSEGQQSADLKVRRLSWIIWVGPIYNKGPYNGWDTDTGLHLHRVSDDSCYTFTRVIATTNTRGPSQREACHTVLDQLLRNVSAKQTKPLRSGFLSWLRDRLTWEKFQFLWI